MPRITYREFNFQASTLNTIDKANEIIAEYKAQGFDMTLRQLYYQFVRRVWIENKMSEYKNLGRIINDARLAGLIDWKAIVDRTRNLQKWENWTSPRAALESARQRYRENLWRDQPYYIEAWVEKEALIGVLEDACGNYVLPHFACKGYVSQSEMWAAPQRLHAAAKAGKKILILHLGDHDPSGVDMSRDIYDRLNGFSNVSGVRNWELFEIEVERLALTIEQVREFNPPPNPTKTTDSRAAEYIALYGHDSWELDALEPTVIARLIREAIEERLDRRAWDASVVAEDESRGVLAELIAGLPEYEGIEEDEDWDEDEDEE